MTRSIKDILKPKRVSREELSEIIKTRKPIGKFYTKEDNWWVGVSNLTGDAWTEEFETFNDLKKWLF